MQKPIARNVVTLLSVDITAIQLWPQVKAWRYITWALGVVAAFAGGTFIFLAISAQWWPIALWWAFGAIFLSKVFVRYCGEVREVDAEKKRTLQLYGYGDVRPQDVAIERKGNKPFILTPSHASLQLLRATSTRPKARK